MSSSRRRSSGRKKKASQPTFVGKKEERVSKTKSKFLAQSRFYNELPDIVCPAKALPLPWPSARLYRHRGGGLTAGFKLHLVPEEQGMPIDFVDMDHFNYPEVLLKKQELRKRKEEDGSGASVSSGAAIDLSEVKPDVPAEDVPLLAKPHQEQKERLDPSRQNVGWLQKTTISTNDLYDRTTGRRPDAAVAASKLMVNKQVELELEDLQAESGNRERQLAEIEASFEDVKQFDLKHPTRRGLKAVDVAQVFPDAELPQHFVDEDNYYVPDPDADEEADGEAAVLERKRHELSEAVHGVQIKFATAPAEEITRKVAMGESEEYINNHELKQLLRAEREAGVTWPQEAARRSLLLEHDKGDFYGLYASDEVIQAGHESQLDRVPARRPVPGAHRWVREFEEGQPTPAITHRDRIFLRVSDGDVTYGALQQRLQLRKRTRNMETERLFDREVSSRPRKILVVEDDAGSSSSAAAAAAAADAAAE